MNIYLIRHAIATKSLNGYGAHIIDAPILPEGVLVTQRIGKYITKVPTDINLSSEYPRCRQTVALLSELSDKKFIFDKRLNEYHEINFQKFVNQIKALKADLDREQYASVFICTHAAVIAVILNIIKNKQTHESDLVTNYPKTGVLLNIVNSKITEIDFNLL